MDWKPGDLCYVTFETSDATGKAVNADSLPTATVNRNGTDDATTVQVTNIDAGSYKAAWTFPATYIPTDVINIRIAATISTIATKASIGPFRVGLGLPAAGTAAAGGASTITLQTALGADGLGKGCLIVLVSGTGAPQAAIITGYVNSTKVVTVDRAWITNPDSTTTYAILPAELISIATGVAPAASGGLPTVGATIPNATAGAAGGLVIAGSNAATTFATLTSTGAFTINGTSDVAQSGDSYGIVNNSTYGNAKLVRSTTPANALSVDSSGNVTFNNTSIATVTYLTNAPTSGDFTAAMKASIGTAVAASAVASVTGNVGGNVVGSVGSVTAAVTFSNTSIGTVTYLTNAPTNGDFTAAMKTSLNAATPSVTVSGTVVLDATQPNYAPAKAGNQMDLVNAPNATAITAIGVGVWATTTRTLSSFGTLVADVATAVWAAATRTLSAFGFTVNTNANTTETAIKAKTDLIATNAADSPNAVTAQGTAAQLQYGIQSNGIGGYQATANWLALSPSSGGGNTNNYYISVPGGITGSANAPFDNFQLLLKQNYTFTQTFTYAPGYSIGAYTQIAFMLKQAAGSDQSSVAWVIVSNPPQADDGLYWFNGAPPTSPLSKSDASIVVSATGITVTMSPTLTSLLSPQAVYAGEIAQFTSTGKVPLGTGTVSVNAPVIDQLTPVS